MTVRSKTNDHMIIELFSLVLPTIEDSNSSLIVFSMAIFFVNRQGWRGFFSYGEDSTFFRPKLFEWRASEYALETSF